MVYLFITRAHPLRVFERWYWKLDTGHRFMFGVALNTIAVLPFLLIKFVFTMGDSWLYASLVFMFLGLAGCKWLTIHLSRREQEKKLAYILSKGFMR